MALINMKKELSGDIETAVAMVTAALKDQGFGVLSRIDLHSKVKEKIGKDLKPTVILGACNPSLAYDAYLANSDVASLLPCNAVIREIGEGRLSVELARPTALMQVLGDPKLVEMAKEADEKLERALQMVATPRPHEAPETSLHP